MPCVCRDERGLLVETEEVGQGAMCIGLGRVGGGVTAVFSSLLVHFVSSLAFCFFFFFTASYSCG